jgi:hypothetical protein
MSWQPPTDQQMFDNACLGIIGQGYAWALGKTSCGRDVCVVETLDGRRCALGHSIADHLVNFPSTPQWDVLFETPLGRRLARAHDRCARFGGSRPRLAWKREMAKIALEFGLDDSCLYFVLKAGKS